jgi:hypothetical protein
MEILRANGVATSCFLPLTTAYRKLGALSFGYLTPHQIDAAELDFMGRAARNGKGFLLGKAVHGR